MTEEQKPIPDKTPGLVPRERMRALAERAGPSLDAVGRRSPVILWGLFLIVLGLITLAVLQWVISAAVHTRKEVVVPDVVGKSVEQALDVLSPLSLSLGKEAVEFDENYPSGAILRQIPSAGLKVREGKVIRVTISSGGQVVFVPDMVNKPLPEAQNQLRSAGLVPGALTEVYSQRYEAGWVMDQNPVPGGVTSRGQMVDLRVSRGAPPEGTLLMPDFVNRSHEQAAAWARDNNIKADVKEEVTPDVLPGLVLRQAPAPDETIDPSRSLEFVVSRSTLTASNAQMVRYEIPQGSGRVHVRIVLRDEVEEREVYQGYQSAGSVAEVPVVPRGLSRVRIFVNGVLIEERVLP
ncbi:MAG: PASTA domain-containing protein [Elusimicrobia bacterium]|nr:PASTA domain-containing protein [Elusimicrobiota bacterium]